MGGGGNNRGLALLGLLGVGILLAYVVFGGADYTVKAQFENAGQLVEGGEVQVGGRVVGTIAGVELNEAGLAEVELEITDGDIDPLHSGTRAQIKAVGPAGITNRYVNLIPGSDQADELEDGATIPPEQTAGIVELDSLLNTFTPDVRDDVGSLMRHSADVFAGSGEESWNRMLVKLDPAMAEIGGLFEEVGSDEAQFESLIESTERAATAIASRRPDLVSAVGTSARWLDAVAVERERLEGLLARAPEVLDRGSTTLALADTSVNALIPTLREVPSAAGPLQTTLTEAVDTLPQAVPVVEDLTSQLPGLNQSFRRIKRAAPAVRPALRSTGEAFGSAQPILRGVRLYAADFLLGIVNGLAGISTGNFNASGHYTHAAFVEAPELFVASPLAELVSEVDLTPDLIDLRTGLTSRCPGALAPPAPDGSSPNHDVTDLCDPEQSMSPLVNEPPSLLP